MLPIGCVRVVKDKVREEQVETTPYFDSPFWERWDVGFGIDG